MKLLMSADQVDESLRRLSGEIIADAPNGAPLAIVGIRRRGAIMAQRMLPMLDALGRPADHSGVLDITLYRDDLTTIGPDAQVRGTEIDFDITNTWLVLVDDVLFTGRSVRAGLDALMDLGRPKCIKLAVMVDRGWRELPIQADYSALDVETTLKQVVHVKLLEIDEVDGVELHERDD